MLSIACSVLLFSLCVLVASVSSLSSASCGEGDYSDLETFICALAQPDVTVVGRQAHTVLPSCTNANITDTYGIFQVSNASTLETLAAIRHYAYPPENNGTGKLWVHLPGTYDAPYDTTDLASVGQNYHTLHLAYNNSVPIGTFYCSSSLGQTEAQTDECFWLVRYLMVTGSYFPIANPVYTGPYPLLNWPYDSIMYRIYYALLYLNCKYPSEGWGQFISNGQVVWNNVLVSGHSQGGGHAAVIGFLENVTSVTMLSSVCDYSNWTMGTYHARTTPSASWYGFGDPLENCACPFSVQTFHWNNVGALSFGSPVLSSLASYGTTHTMEANYETTCASNSTELSSRAFYYVAEYIAKQKTAENATCGIFCCDDFFIHLSTQSDICTPINTTTDGATYAERAWAYVLGISESGHTTTSSGHRAASTCLIILAVVACLAVSF